MTTDGDKLAEVLEKLRDNIVSGTVYESGEPSYYNGDISLLFVPEIEAALTAWNTRAPTHEAGEGVTSALAEALELVLPLAKGYRPDGQSERARRTCDEWICSAEVALTAYRAASAHGGSEGWCAGKPPADGRLYEVLHRTVVKWTPYKTPRRHAGSGKGGRWQESNGYGGFDNTDINPVFHRMLKTTVPLEPKP